MSASETEGTNKTVGSVAEAWWKGLESRTGARARLKRSGSILELALEPETHVLKRQLFAVPDLKASIEIVALVAGVLTWIDDRSSLSPGVQLGKLADKQSSIEPRFLRLLKEDRNSGDDLLTQWRRILALLKGSANPGALAETLFYWGDSQKKQLATEFYENVSR